jgi:hypothetical protein
MIEFRQFFDLSDIFYIFLDIGTIYLFEIFLFDDDIVGQYDLGISSKSDISIIEKSKLIMNEFDTVFLTEESYEIGFPYEQKKL